MAATVDNSLQVNFENAISTVYSNGQVSPDDANSILLGELILQNVNSKENFANYIADDELSRIVSDFVSENRTLIAQMALQKKQLTKILKSKGVYIPFTTSLFWNWSKTILRFLYIVKPKTREEVVGVVNVCIEQKVKVSFTYMHGNNIYYIMYILRNTSLTLLNKSLICTFADGSSWI